MSKKEYILIGLVLVLGGLYAVFFSDWFKPKFIRIEHTVRSSREAWTGNGRRVDPQFKGSGSVTFSLHKAYKLTSVQVLRIDEFQTNRYAHPIWSVVSAKGSMPTEGFAYGFTVKGMSPAVVGAEPEALEPEVEYQLVVQAGKLKGTNNFKLEQPVSLRR